MLRRTLRGKKHFRIQAQARTFWKKDSLTAQGVIPRIDKWDHMNLKGMETLSVVQRQAAEWEISNSYASHGLMSRMYKELQKVNIRKP